jgi:dephospho-CoA kinase
MPTPDKHPAKPVIGIAGGIGSGKSTIARMFGSLGCAVIDSDAVAHQVLQSDAVKQELKRWLGEGVFHPNGSVNRKAVAAAVFTDAARTKRLNSLIHPRVAQEREVSMKQHQADPRIVAIIWDTPLLFEAGLDQYCDAVVFVDVPREERLRRLREKRGWEAPELDKREKLQFPLDKKAQLADYDIDNSRDEASSLRQVQRVLSQILASVV